MPRTHTTRHGSSRIGLPYRGVRSYGGGDRLFCHAGGLSDDEAACPVCGFTIRLRHDGTLPAHRVGTERSLSWPCPGSREPAARQA
jgi:hypothetical protein